MKKKSLVSVAMATYNGGKYLSEQLDSIYSQTFNNFEVIVIDDASEDNTLLILEEYKIKFGLEYSINKKNLGVTKTFEKAISLCSGKFILLSDQDDIWKSNKIEVLLNNIGDNSLIYSNAEIIDENGSYINITTKDYYPIFGKDSRHNSFYEYLVLNSFILGCTMMFRTDIVKNNIIYSTSRNHDWYLVMLANHHCGVIYLNESLTLYRHHSNNYSRAHTKLPLAKVIYRYFNNNKELKESSIKMIEQKKIVEHLIENDLYKSNSQLLFLNQILRYTESFLSTKIHFRAFFIALKYNNYIITTSNSFKRLIFLFLKLVG